ncbi:MAG: PEGA domain-containing protein [Ignavibacteria bacterium]|nr:PEGA domain-containing protein [Ignavibacteria bacterium]
MRKIFVAACCMFTMFLTSCATVLNTTTQDISVQTSPQTARITIDSKKFGNTPQVINLDRKEDHTLKLEADGYEVYETQITRKVSSWVWLNALNGFLPGLLIDYITGSMYNLVPEQPTINLMQLPPPKPPEKPVKK